MTSGPLILNEVKNLHVGLRVSPQRSAHFILEETGNQVS